MTKEPPILSIEEVAALNTIAHNIDNQYYQWLFDGVCIICNKKLWRDKDGNFYSGITIRIHGRQHLKTLKAFL